MLRSLRSLRRPPSPPEKWTFQLWLDTRIDITAPLGDDGSDTTAHSCSVVASAATSTVHHYVATSPGSLDEVRPLRLDPLRPRDPRSRIWNEFVDRYHYLGHKNLPGAQLRYFVHARDGLPLALLGFGAAAWKTAPRDRFVGWTPAVRERNLPLVVNHARFLILPWIRVPHLASHLLAQVERCLPADWHRRYNLRPVLLETFCETPRFRGTCYRAANWLHLGQTLGRGKLDTHNEYALPIKDIFVKPLCADWKAVLNR